jgi:outer membrane lipoprotein SlyB
MKFYILLVLLITASCSSNTGTGVITGGVIGGAAGGIAGGGKGGFIGSASGMIVGGLIGAILDEQDRRVMKKSSPRTVDRMDRGDPLTINDVIKLSQNGVSDDTIVRYLEKTYSLYSLSQIQIRRLQESGVSQSVINNMIKLEK